MEDALTLRNVTAGYRGRPVLTDVSFALPAGELAALIGPNGAGKTTLLRAITGLIRADSGEIRLFGHNLSDLPATERARYVGVVPQDLETPMAFTVGQIVLMGRSSRIRRWASPSGEDRRIAERAMAYTDVLDMKNRPFTELSGGERQRAVIAMVLAQQPRLVLMDEPTSHLDMNHRMEVMQIVERMNRDETVTVLIVSHDLNLAAESCRRLLLLDRGRLAANGPPRDVLTESRLRSVYRCDVHVQDNPANGSVLVMPAAKPPTATCGRGVRVHVIGGGGCAEELLRRLTLHEYAVTCGVLNEGDSDAVIAAALGIPCALEKPFSPIGPRALAAARDMAEPCDALIVSGVPFGTGNVANLELAADALARHRPVFLMEGSEQRDYTPGLRAGELTRRLLAGGATLYRAIPDLLPLLPRAP